MKIRYYFMSMLLACTAMVGFTSCDDDDDDELAPVNVVKPGEGGEDYRITSDTVKVKIGEETRVALPVEGGQDVRGFSLDETVAKVVETPQGWMIEGFKNGTAGIMLTDANGNFKKIIASVYTTDVMTLNMSAIELNAPLGESVQYTECAVELGNGGYTAASDNANVTAVADPATGAIAISARGRLEAYTATVTVTDISGLTASVTISVTSSTDGFTQEAIDEILAKTSRDAWFQGYGIRDHKPSYMGWGSYGTWLNTDTDGTHTLGWWMNQWGSDYGGLRIEYPTGTAVGEEVAGKLYFQYGHLNYYDLNTYDVTVKVIEDNDTRTVAIAWQIDTENEYINKAYLLVYK